VSKIGEFEQENTGFIGGIEALGIQMKGVRFKSQDKGADYTIYGPDGIGELGAAWLKSGDYGDYLSVRLDCPTLPAPINATMKMTPTEDGLYVLRWQRRDLSHGNGPRKREGGDNGAA
jgi:uncharacterized protein (DUF736 family)